MPHRIPFRSLALFAACLAWGPAHAQELQAELPGAVWYEAWGWASAGLGDLNGDGVDDFVVSAPRNMPLATGFGRVRAFSGATLTPLWTVSGGADKGDFGYALADVGDLNGDGVHDLAVGAPDLVAGPGHGPVGSAGSVELRSGSGGGLLYKLFGDDPGDMFGAAVCSVGDVDLDGVGDFAVGAVGDDDGGDGAGSLRVFSGASGAVLATVHGAQAKAGFGGALAGPVDFDGNGAPEILVGAASHDGVGEDAGAVFLVPAAGGASLFTWFGPEADAHFGGAIAVLGDADLDGTADFAVGAIEADGVTISSGAVFVYSGASKALLFSRTGDATAAYLGRSLAAAGDVDLDGRADLLAGASYSKFQGQAAGHAVILSGLGGAELGRVYGNEYEYLGTSASNLGDLDGDGRAELGIGAIDADFNQRGLLRIYSTATPMPPSSYCTAKTNSQGCKPLLSAQGTPTASGPDDFVLTADGVINNKVGMLIWSHSASAWFTFGGTLCLGSPVNRTTGAASGGNPGADDCSGAIAFHADQAFLAANGLTPGTLWHAQVWYRDPALPFQQVGLSQALAIVVAP